jgi:hypothetical protein
MTASDTIRLTLREIRLILERLVQAAGTPAGLLPSVRDCAVYSVVMPGPGLAGIARQIELLRASRFAPLRMAGELPEPTIDCAGQHAWPVAENLLDLAVEQFRLTGHGRVIAVNVAEPCELRVVAGLAERFDLSAGVETASQTIVLEVAARPVSRRGILDTVRHQGIAVAASSWWPLYQASHDALMPDSYASRRHAGTIRVEADGRIVGRNDEDETDLAMLTPNDPSSLRPNPVSSAS